MIAFDTAVSTGQLSGSTVSFNHTCTGANRILFVSFWAALTDTVTSVTYNGVPMVLVDKKATPGDRWVYLYALANPDSGTNAVQVTFSASTICRFISSSYTGAAQTGQPDAHSSTSVVAQTSVTPTLTTLADNCWTVMVTKNTAGGDPIAGTGSTRRGNTGNLGFFDSNGAITPPGSASLQATGSLGNWGAAMGSFSPYAPKNNMTLLGV